MNTMKLDRDKCQFLDSDPKTQLHGMRWGREGSATRGGCRDVGAFKWTGILAAIGQLTKPASTDLGGVSKGPGLGTGRPWWSGQPRASHSILQAPGRGQPRRGGSEA